MITEAPIDRIILVEQVTSKSGHSPTLTAYADSEVRDAVGHHDSLSCYCSGVPVKPPINTASMHLVRKSLKVIRLWYIKITALNDVIENVPLIGIQNASQHIQIAEVLVPS